jgi:hypothetical protein
VTWRPKRCLNFISTSVPPLESRNVRFFIDHCFCTPREQAPLRRTTLWVPKPLCSHFVHQILNQKNTPSRNHWHLPISVLNDDVLLHIFYIHRLRIEDEDNTECQISALGPPTLVVQTGACFRIVAESHTCSTISTRSSPSVRQWLSHSDHDQ